MLVLVPVLVVVLLGGLVILVGVSGGVGPSGPSGSITPPNDGPGATVVAPTAACLYLARVLSAPFGLNGVSD